MRAEMVRWMLCCLLVAGAARRVEAQSAPRLLEDVVARGAWLRLSDLLPAETSPKLLAEARLIELGRLPEPGNFRVLRRDGLTKAIGRVRVSVPEQVIVHSWGWPTSRERVEEALAAVRLDDVDLSTLEWPREHLLRTADPPLRVTAVRPASSTRLQIRFECQSRADCAPFWGEIEGNGKAEMPRRRANAVALAAQAMVEPGRPALLVFNDHVVRIRMRVMPLGRGGVGERIKVFDRNSRKVLLAKVEGRDLVSSELKEGR